MNSLTRRVRKLENDPSQVSEYERSIWLCEHFGLSREWVEMHGRGPKNLQETYELFGNKGRALNEQARK